MMFNRNAGGAAKYPGSNLIPQGLKGKGLMEHPKSAKSKEDGPCGILAVLLSFNKSLYLSNVKQWYNDANKYGELIGLKSNYMKNEDFDELVKLDEFTGYRIVIFTRTANVEYAAQGKVWKWPDNSLRTEPDSNSLYLMRDETNPEKKHYWCVEGVKQLLEKRNSKEKVCFVCFRKAQGQSFDEHPCYGVRNYQCQICKRNFTSPESKNNHLDKKTDDVFDCECCGRKIFYGLDCYNRHLLENCHPPKGYNQTRCETCKRRYNIEMEHNCDKFFWPCRNCKHEFVDYNDYDTHRCALQVEERFWDPTPEGKFNCHFAYDFETCREKETEENQTEFKHEIMAWCVQLIVPDDFTRHFIRDTEYCKKVKNKIGTRSERIVDDIKSHLIGETIRFRGKSIESFIFLVGDILVQSKGKEKWFPTFWAHNGSKFDAKFLLDYFLNVKNYDLAGSTYDDESIDVKKNKETGKSEWKKNPPRKGKKAIVQVSMIGSKVLEMVVDGALFRCSYAHHTAPLRNLPKTFGLDTQTKKGEFPYPLLRRENWGKIFPKFPSKELFDVDSMSDDRRSEVLGWYQCQPLNQPWDFDKELWEYLDSDVDVLCKVLEKYHEKAEELHEELWRKHPEKLDKVV